MKTVGLCVSNRNSENLDRLIPVNFETVLPLDSLLWHMPSAVLLGGVTVIFNGMFSINDLLLSDTFTR